MWDLARDAHVPVCEQRVAARAALTRLAFSAAHPVMLIGDERCACASGSTNLPHLHTLLDLRAATCMPGRVALPWLQESHAQQAETSNLYLTVMRMPGQSRALLCWQRMEPAVCVQACKSQLQ